MSRLTLEKNLNSYCFPTLILSKTCKYGIKTHGSFINSVFILFAMVHNTTLTGALNTNLFANFVVVHSRFCFFLWTILLSFITGNSCNLTSLQSLSGIKGLGSDWQLGRIAFVATTKIFKLGHHVYIPDDTQCRPCDKLLTFLEVIVVPTILSGIQLGVANCTLIVAFQSCPLPLSK